MKTIKAERDLSFDFLRVTEAAAIESAKTMGQGDRKYSDHVAVEAMREVMDTVPMRGRIVIGEGERDEAPMLYIGEEVGGGIFSDDARTEFPEVDFESLEGPRAAPSGDAADALTRRPDVAAFYARLADAFALPAADVTSHDDLQALVAALAGVGLVGGPVDAHPHGAPHREVPHADGPHRVEGWIWDARPSVR